MVKVLGVFFSLYMVIVWILSGLIHLWTVYIAYTFSGLFFGIVSFFFPVISQVFWGYQAWRIDGFNSPYIQWIIVLVILWVVYYVLAFIVSVFEKRA